MHVRFAQVEPTTRCNYTCGFCVGRHMPQQDITIETFTHFIARVEGLEAIELQGEGEPLLHPDFFELIRIAREKFPQVEISMISNGSMFTKEIVERILDANIAHIYVSAESVDDADFQRIRGGKLERVRRGIRHLLAQRKARNLTRPLVGLSITALRSTVKELPEKIPLFYRSLDLDGGINIQPLQVMPQYTPVYDDAMRQELIDQPASMLLQQAFRTSEPLRNAMNEATGATHPGFYPRLYGSVDGRFFCPWLENGIYISTQGQVMPCCHVKNYDKDTLGEIQTDEQEINAQRIAMKHALHQGIIPSACQGCSVATTVTQNIKKVRALQARQSK